MSGVFDDKGTIAGGVFNDMFTGRNDCGVVVLGKGKGLSIPCDTGTVRLLPDISIEGRTLEFVAFSGSKYEFRFFTGSTFGCSWAFDLDGSSTTVLGTGVILLLMSARKFCLKDSRSALLAFGLVFRYLAKASSCCFFTFRA